MVWVMYLSLQDDSRFTLYRDDIETVSYDLSYKIYLRQLPDKEWQCTYFAKALVYILNFSIYARTYDLIIRIAAYQSGGKIQFYLDNATLTDLVDVPVTSGWQTWQTLRIPNVEIPGGQHKLVARFYFGGFNLNYIDFNQISVGVNDENSLPQKYMLYQNYPNPFNPSTTIKYSIPNVRQGHASALQNVVLKVYDILGREITTLVNEEEIPGNYTIEFDASHLTNGVYFYDLQANQYNQTRKFVLLK